MWKIVTNQTLNNLSVSYYVVRPTFNPLSHLKQDLEGSLAQTIILSDACNTQSSLGGAYVNFHYYISMLQLY